MQKLETMEGSARATERLDICSCIDEIQTHWPITDCNAYS